MRSRSFPLPRETARKLSRLGEIVLGGSKTPFRGSNVSGQRHPDKTTLSVYLSKRGPDMKRTTPNAPAAVRQPVLPLRRGPIVRPRRAALCGPGAVGKATGRFLAERFISSLLYPSRRVQLLMPRSKA